MGLLGVQVGAGHTAVQHLKNSNKRMSVNYYINVKKGADFLQDYGDRHFDD